MTPMPPRGRRARRPSTSAPPDSGQWPGRALTPDVITIATTTSAKMINRTAPLVTRLALWGWWNPGPKWRWWDMAASRLRRSIVPSIEMPRTRPVRGISPFWCGAASGVLPDLGQDPRGQRTGRASTTVAPESRTLDGLS